MNCYELYSKLFELHNYGSDILAMVMMVVVAAAAVVVVVVVAVYRLSVCQYAFRHYNSERLTELGWFIVMVLRHRDVNECDFGAKQSWIKTV